MCDPHNGEACLPPNSRRPIESAHNLSRCQLHLSGGMPLEIRFSRRSWLILAQAKHACVECECDRRYTALRGIFYLLLNFLSIIKPLIRRGPVFPRRAYLHFALPRRMHSSTCAFTEDIGGIEWANRVFSPAELNIGRGRT